MKKKMRKFNDGGYTGDDEIVKYRMGMIDAKGNDLTKSKQETSDDLDPYGAANRETSNDLDPYGAASKKPASVEKTVVKTKVTPKVEPKAEPKATTKVEEKANPVQQLKDVVKGKDVTAFKLYDPLAKYEQTGPKRSEATAPKPKAESKPIPVARTNSEKTGFELKKEKALGLKMGGKVKSASARADGCAVRGKTRA